MWRALKFAFVTRLPWLYIYFVGKTSAIASINAKYQTDFEAAQQLYINALWHERQAAFAYTHRGLKISPLVSPSKDGDIMTRVLQLFGFTATRGSSRREPRKGLMSLMRRIKEGYCLAITPDGPVGPRREVKQGTLYLAQKLRLPILPVTNGMKRKLVFKSWDRFQLPLPFNYIVLVYGAPIWIKPEDDLEQKAAELKKALDEITEQADRAACQQKM